MPDWSSVLNRGAPRVLTSFIRVQAEPPPFTPGEPSSERVSTQVKISTSPAEAGALFPDGAVTEFPTEQIVDLYSTTETFIGFAAPGSSHEMPVWRIAKVDEDGPETLVLYAGGTAGRIHRWSQRTTYDYQPVA